jgi:hypothetical protein
MKIIITAAAASLLTASVSAADIYRHLGEGNWDLAHWNVDTRAITGVQPGGGDSIDIYWGFADGNHDIHQPVGPIAGYTGGVPDDGKPIYVGPGRIL